MRTTISSLMLAGVAGLASAAAPTPTTAAENILFNCFFPPQHYVCREMVPELGKRIEKATAGRVTITIPPKSVAAPPDQYDAVVNGVADGALQFNHVHLQQGGRHPGGAPAVRRPGGLRAGQCRAMAHLPEVLRRQGRNTRAWCCCRSGSAMARSSSPPSTSRSRPWRTSRTRKMWALPGTVANLVKETGAPVVAGPAVQMLEIISKGVVDGYAGVPVSTAQEFKLVPYTKSVTFFKAKIFQPTFSFFVSEKKWGKISAADQAAIRKAMGEDFARWAGELQDPNHEANKAKVYGARREAHRRRPMPSLPSSRPSASPRSMPGSSGSTAWASTARRRSPTTSKCSARHLATVKK